MVRGGNVGFSIEVSPQRGAEMEPVRKAAEDARAYVLREYRALLVRSMTDADAAREIPPDFINLLLARIGESQEGAFRPFLQRPVVRALFIPFGSLGGISIIEFLLTRFG